MLERAKRASHIDPPASSYAIMRRARPYRGENHGPGKDTHRELDPTPGIREQPGSFATEVVPRECPNLPPADIAGSTKADGGVIVGVPNTVRISRHGFWRVWRRGGAWLSLGRGEQPTGEVRPDVENSQINPSISVRTTRSAGGRPNLASVLRGGENGANIQVRWGAI